MTTAYIDPVLVACLVKSEQKLAKSDWQPHNDRQRELVAGLPDLRRLVETMPVGMMEAIGSTQAAVINEFFAARGLPISVGELGPGEFACGAVLDILVNWAKPGVRARYGINAPDGSEHPAAEMTKGFAVHVNDAGLEIAEPETTSAEVSVLMCVSSDLGAGLASLRRPRSPSPDAFKGLTFPMVDLDQFVDVGWLRGLSCADARITQAFGHAKLRLNEMGAHAKAGAAIVVYRSVGGPRVLRIDKPFTLAFIVAGQIALAFHLTPEVWKVPPNLAAKADKSKGDTW